jgi:hypothetical protein
MSPMRALKPCAKAGCPALVAGGGNRCPLHLESYNSKRDAERRETDESWLLYQTPRWRKFRKWFLARNPICQRIIDGKRCMTIATAVHHRIAVREHPELLCDAEHCVALCAGHHHHHAGDFGDEVYVPTVTD